MRRMRNPNELFVGDLSFFCTEEDLYRLFGNFGVVAEARIKRSDKGGKTLMYGFVRMDSLPPALEAAKYLNGTLYMGREIKVQLSLTNTYYDSSLKIKTGYQLQVSFVSFFSHNIVYPTEERIRSIVQRFGQLNDVMVKDYRIHSDFPKQEGFGYVTFNSEEAAMQAMAYCNGVEIDGIRFEFSRTNRNKMNAVLQMQNAINQQNSVTLGNSTTMYSIGQAGRFPAPAEYESSMHRGSVTYDQPHGNPPMPPRNVPPQAAHTRPPLPHYQHSISRLDSMQQSYNQSAGYNRELHLQQRISVPVVESSADIYEMERQLYRQQSVANHGLSTAAYGQFAREKLPSQTLGSMRIGSERYIDSGASVMSSLSASTASTFASNGSFYSRQQSSPFESMAHSHISVHQNISMTQELDALCIPSSTSELYETSSNHSGETRRIYESDNTTVVGTAKQTNDIIQSLTRLNLQQSAQQIVPTSLLNNVQRSDSKKLSPTNSLYSNSSIHTSCSSITVEEKFDVDAYFAMKQHSQSALLQESFPTSSAPSFMENVSH